MAARLQQFRSKAVQVSNFVSKHGCAYYKELLEKNKQHIVQPPTIEKCQELSKQLFYTRIARPSASPLSYGAAWYSTGEVVNVAHKLCDGHISIFLACFGRSSVLNSSESEA